MSLIKHYGAMLFYVFSPTDYAEERNVIMCDAIPRLKTYCERIGFELQVGPSISI